ncbi:MAG: DUF6206 family protein, partial [Candidatus Bathyarchaeota archaeon]|nr:DUF6206 family protein [Candidatus Bathyarchaeota archaeon]
PLFDDMQQVERYKEIYYRYNELLREINIEVPEYGAVDVVTNDGRIVLYLFQRKLSSDSVGNRIIHVVSDDEVMILVLEVLRELNKVWGFNRDNKPEIEVAIDGQISNWAIRDFDPGNLVIDEDVNLLYFDTSTPLMRENGVEMLDAELFLKPTPPLMRLILKKFYLQEILDRYYDFRKVVVDLIANFFKEGRSDLIPKLVDLANEFFSAEAVVPDIMHIDYEEVRKYYKEDASIWSLYLNMRKVHRFIRTRILRRYYDFVLPAEIKR